MTSHDVQDPSEAQPQGSMAVAAGLWIAYLGGIPLFQWPLGDAGALITIPVMATAWLFGLRAGVIGAIIAFPINTGLYMLSQETLDWLVITRQGGGFGMLALIPVGAVVGKLRDLRRKTLASETRLRRIEQRQGALLAAAPDQMFRVGTDGTVRDVWSGSAAHGLNRREAPPEPRDGVGQNLESWLPPDLAEAWRDLILATCEGAPPEPLQFQDPQPGSSRFLEARFVPSSTDEALVAVADITSRVKIESELLAAQRETLEARTAAELLRTNRLASVGVLAGGVGHEINNPLTYVIGSLEEVEEALGDLERGEGVDHDDLRRAIGAGRKGAEKIRAVVGELRQFSRIEDTSPAVPVDAGEILKATLRLVTKQVIGQGELADDVGPLPEVLGHPSRLAQVFTNLLLHAGQRAQTAAGRTPRITVHGWSGADRTAVIEISDNGPAMEAEDRARLFEPFFSPDGPTQNGGLGLSVSHRIVTEMGGGLDIRSMGERGNVLRLTLPGAGVPRARREAEEPEAFPARLRRPRRTPDKPGSIVIVDDDALVAKALARILRHHRVEIYTDGKTAADVLSAAPPVDLVFCDLMMPGVSGMEVFRRVGQAAPQMAERFIFITGGAFSDEARSFLAGVDNPRIEKPFDTGAIHDLTAELGALGPHTNLTDAATGT